MNLNWFWNCNYWRENWLVAIWYEHTISIWQKRQNALIKTVHIRPRSFKWSCEEVKQEIETRSSNACKSFKLQIHNSCVDGTTTHLPSLLFLEQTHTLTTTSRDSVKIVIHNLTTGALYTQLHCNYLGPVNRKTVLGDKKCEKTL